jgi:aminomethyltransferase
MTGKKTPLYDEHVRLGAKIVDFAGWDMPLHYGSQLDEHMRVRGDAGMFDVSHMTVTDVQGARSLEFLRYMFANDAGRLAPGQALYTCMLNPQGGVIDDLIVYRLARDGEWRLITNAATRDKDLAWFGRYADDFRVTLTMRDDTALIAVQGPRARDKVHAVLDAELRAAASALANFHAVEGRDLFIARTGYTGEEGYEVLAPARNAPALWRDLLAAGVMPVGLGARDTLRLEAGMALYGQDMDENTTPIETGLGWTVAWRPEERDFIGRKALEAMRAGDGFRTKSVGLVLRGKGVLRAHQKVYAGDCEVGEITSGSFSPVLESAIALARVDRDIEGACTVDVRGRRLEAAVVKPPFVRHGKACVQFRD